MSKNRTLRDTKHAAAKPLAPAEVRAQLERADREIVELLNRHAKLAADAAPASADGRPPLALAQEDEQIAAALAHNKGPLSDDCVRGVFRELVSGTRWLRPFSVTLTSAVVTAEVGLFGSVRMYARSGNSALPASTTWTLLVSSAAAAGYAAIAARAAISARRGRRASRVTVGDPRRSS